MFRVFLRLERDEIERMTMDDYIYYSAILKNVFEIQATLSMPRNLG